MVICPCYHILISSIFLYYSKKNCINSSGSYHYTHNLSIFVLCFDGTQHILTNNYQFKKNYLMNHLTVSVIGQFLVLWSALPYSWVSALMRRI